MNGFLYGVGLQWKLDIRSKSLLITCYIVPLLFFAVMGGIFTAVTPDAKNTLIQSMTIMGVSMGAFVGLPPSIVEIYGSDIKKSYKANGVPIYLGVITLFISSFIHLFIMSVVIFAVAPIAFSASLPANLPLYFCSLAVFLFVSLGVGCVLGLAVKNQSRLTMLSQLLFLPSIMLSGIMFPSDMLPKVFGVIGKIFPASWSFELMVSFSFEKLFPLLIILLISVILCCVLLKRQKKS